MSQLAPGSSSYDLPVELPVEHVSLSDPEFKTQLAQVIPHLRAFGRSLSGSRDVADDLVQETLLKAWAARKRFQANWATCSAPCFICPSRSGRR